MLAMEKKLWKGIREIIHFKPTTNHKLIKIVENNNELSDSKHIADVFNNYFANVGKVLETEIPIVNRNHVEYLHRPLCNSLQEVVK